MSDHNWGGSAGGGGVEFQAAVTALCLVHMACGTPLCWFGTENDVPLSVSAETGGAGDDISLTLLNGGVTEIQVKLSAKNSNEKLWFPLIALFKHAYKDPISNGVLVVGPGTSSSIKDKLARDIIRIGQGRVDDLSSLGCTLIKKLSEHSIPTAVCNRVRIHTVHVLELDDASVQSSIAHLKHICDQPKQAWEYLRKEGLRLIRVRGRHDAASIVPIIPKLRVDATGPTGPSIIARQLFDWMLSQTTTFTIPVWDKQLSLDKDWIELKARSLDKPDPNLASLAEALTHYHEGASSKGAGSNHTEFDAETLGYFVRHCVIVAGPGMGKSQLLRRISRLLAKKKEPSLLISLRPLAGRMRSGETFIEAALNLGLDGSSLNPNDVLRLGLNNLTLLLDGLDESADEQENIARSVVALAKSYPRCRIVFATRPIGYETSLLSSWRHYELISFNESDSRKYVERLVNATIKETTPTIIMAMKAATSHLEYKRGHKTLSAKNPLMIALLASLALNEVIAETTRVSLYAQLFKLIERLTANQKPQNGLTSAILYAFLKHLGWELSCHPHATAEQVISSCASRLSVELEIPVLKAGSICEEALIFWEKTGIVEKVRYRFTEALTFVHKTFGEYAAAQFLSSNNPIERTAVLQSIESEPSWNEVLIFASAMGLAEELAQIALDKQIVDSKSNLRLVRWSKHSKSKLNPVLGEKVLQRLWKVITGYHSRQALDLGLELLEALPNLPNTIIDPEPYRTHSQWWTSLVAWSWFIKSSPHLISFGELLVFLDHLRKESDTRKASDGFNLYRADRDLIDELLILATYEVIKREQRIDEENFIQYLRGIIGTYSIGFANEISKIMESAGIGFALADQGMMFPKLFDSKKLEVMRQADLTMLNDIVGDYHEQTEPVETPLLHLSAFCYGTNLMNMSLSDLYEATGESGRNEAKEIIKAAALLSSYDHGQLIAEAKTEINRIKREGSLISSLLSVDAIIEWKASPHTTTKNVIAQALLHSSDWIVLLAANIAEKSLTVNEIIELVPEVLEKSESQGAAAAAQLAIRFLGEEQARDLMITRLKRPFNSGSQHIFEFLAAIWTPGSDVHLKEILANALFFGPVTAKAALKLVMVSGQRQSKALSPLLKDAYNYWLKNEKPYPVGGGTVPISPRGEILSILIENEDMPVTDLFEAAKDPRRDVSEQANEALHKAILASEAVRSEFVLRLTKGESYERLLALCLKSKVAFERQEVTKILDLLKSPQSKTRLAATGVLALEYLSVEEIQENASKLLQDSYQYLRDKGVEILSDLRV